MADLLGGNEPAITLDDCKRCVTRELAMRRKVYPRWTAAGKMTKGDADREIAVMEEVLRHLNEVAGLRNCLNGAEAEIGVLKKTIIGLAKS